MTERTKDLARLERVDPKDIWEDEPGDFTPWLTEPENLKQLGTTLGLELEDAEREVSVGGYYADIVATTSGDGRKVVIENQLEKTDHGHLGQILTYAAGLDALTVVWIAKHFTEEHRAALAWLNKHTTAKIGFFGLEIEVWKIGDSPCAPKFNVVAKPNEWTKTLPDKTLTPTQQTQVEFWGDFIQYATAHASRIRPTSAGPRHWMSLSIGRSGFALQAIASTYGDDGKPEIRAELLMRDSTQHFEKLSDDRGEIELRFDDESLTWYSEEGVQQARIYCRKSIDWRDREERNRCYEWLVKNLDRLHEAFQPRIYKLS